ncbi:MAG: sugar ABC transporter permease [Actinomycetes bacterium]|jgi:putative multiple sugar transport system permease protein|nr:sugar ABC transporter permease [Actinomycetes bacterium]
MIKRVFSVLKNNAMVVALAAVMVLFQVWIVATNHGSLFSPMNASNVILQNAYVIILAVGMLLCIISSGNIDLSVGSIVVLVGAVVGTLVVNMHLPVWIGIVAGLLLGVLIGAWQGFWIAYVRIPAFIVTLAGMLLFRGLALIVLNGLTISPFPELFQKIFAGYVPEGASQGSAFIPTAIVTAIACVVFAVTQIVGRARQKKAGAAVGSEIIFWAKLLCLVALVAIFGLLLGQHKGIPTVLILIVVIIAVYSYITQKTVPGRHLYAMGGNEKAAKLSGINTNRMLLAVYTSMGLLSAVAALVCCARFNSAAPSAGDGYELDAIASCYIGGASAFGGTGKVSGAVIGALFMGVLNIGMSIVGIDANWQKAVKGFVLLAAVVFDVLSKRQASAE